MVTLTGVEKLFDVPSDPVAVMLADAVAASGPSTDLQDLLIGQAGGGVVIGIDEVGRGAWAGPLVVAASAAPAGTVIPSGLNDSKLVPASHRIALVEELKAAGYVTVAEVVDTDMIDRVGMAAALVAGASAAAQKAADQTGVPVAAVICDGTVPLVDPLTWAPARVLAAPGGDRAFAVCSAASIVAKVTRDQLMVDLAGQFPHWDLDRSYGYPSPAHRQGLVTHGLSGVHRRSFNLDRHLPRQESTTLT